MTDGGCIDIQNGRKVIMLGGGADCQYCHQYVSNLAFHEARCDKREPDFSKIPDWNDETNLVCIED